MKKLIILVLAILLATSAYAKDGIFASYQASVIVPEDDNFGYGKGFFAQAGEIGYGWKYIELGAEWFIANLRTSHASTFTDNSVMGTIKAKYPLPWKWVNRITPYGVIGVGAHFFTNKDMKTDPDQPASPWNTPEVIAKDTCLALKYGGGIEFMVTNNISLFGEASYRYGDTGEPTTVDIYSWSYGGGVKVRF